MFYQSDFQILCPREVINLFVPNASFLEKECIGNEWVNPGFIKNLLKVKGNDGFLFFVQPKDQVTWALAGKGVKSEGSEWLSTQLGM